MRRLLEILFGGMKLRNWAPNKFFKGDELTSLIRFRHEGEIPWFSKMVRVILPLRPPLTFKKNPCPKNLVFI